MTLYVVTQADPAPGEDFRFTVPGRYLYDVTGITATLNTGTAGVAVDSSGNGHDGTYDGNQMFVPGAVVGDDGVQLGPGAPGFGFSAVALPPVMPDLTMPFTMEAWVRETVDDAGVGIVVGYTGHDGASPAQMYFEVQRIDSTDGLLFVNAYTIEWISDPIPGLLDGNWHYVECSSDGTTMAMHCDGTLLISNEFGGPGNVFTNFTATSAGIGSVNGILHLALGAVDEYAIYDQELGSLQTFTHYSAASVSLAAYTAAVLADAPTAFYHLDSDVSSGRQPSLIVNDGTTEVVAIPSGFPAVSTPGPCLSAGQPRLNADTQSTDGTLTTVAIPRLLLPAGYTVGVRTLDLQSTDQWSNVTLWWDDANQASGDPVNAYRFPGPIKLVYRQTGSG